MKTFPPVMPSLTISILGCGWLGIPLAERLLAAGYVVKGSTTTADKMPLLTSKGILPFLIKLLPQPEGNLPDFLQADVLVVDVPPKAGVYGNTFHAEQVQAIADAVVNSPVKWVLYISSTSVYPEHNRIAVEDDVSTPDESADPTGSPAQLVAAEQIINRLAPARQTTVLRCAGLMGYDRIPGKYVAGRTVDSGSVPVNYVHRDDAVAIIASVLANKVTGLYNVVAPQHPTREAVYRQSCAQFNYELPTFVEAPALIPFKIISGEKLVHQLRYSFIYPDPLRFYYGLSV